MAKKAFNKSKAEMKKAADSLEAVGSFITEDDDDEIEVTAKAGEGMTFENKANMAAEQSAKEDKKKPKAAPKKKDEPVAAEPKNEVPVKADKANEVKEPVKEETKAVKKVVDINDIPGGVYIPPLTSRSTTEKLSSVTQLRMTAETDKNIKDLANKIQRSYNYVTNMILEAYFDALNGDK